MNLKEHIRGIPDFPIPGILFYDISIESMVKKFVIGKEYEGVFLKPKYGDASGVRGAARLGRTATY